MTADDFTEAARAEAGRQYSPAARLPAMKPTDRMDELPRRCAIDGFGAGAEWARAHLAAQESDAERAVRELHRQFSVYGHEDDCPDTSDEHRGAHHREDSDGYGENYCDHLPLYTLCDHCRNEDGERLDWPCPTIEALDAARAARRDEEKRDG